LRVSTFGNLVLVFCIVAAFSSIMFTSISWVLVTIAVASVFLYARLRFIHELDHTSLEIERTLLDKMVFAEEPMSVKVQITNRNPTPVFGVIEDLIPDGAEVTSGSNRVTTALKPRTIESFTYTMKLARRGPNEFRGLRIERTDPFGLFEEEQVFAEGFSVNAHAKKGSFDTARKIAGREHFEYAGVSRAPAAVLREQEFNGIRDYVPGDRARDIYWKGLAKTQRLMTKTYTKEGSLRTTIFLDCTRSMRLANGGISKLDHAVELSMQLSSVLISSYHPTGLSMFDEMNIISRTAPALGRHQFQTIVRALRNAPPSIRSAGEGAQIPAAQTAEIPAAIKTADRQREGDPFLIAVAKIMSGGRELGLEGIVKELIAKCRNQQQLFVVISDLGSSRNAVLNAAKLAQRSKNRVLVIHTYDDWYMKTGSPLDAFKLEQMYVNLAGFMRLEAALRRAGASYIRVGPADTASRIVRSIRRGLV
jgi:uncharacterized protein (DUF58 family)